MEMAVSEKGKMLSKTLVQELNDEYKMSCYNNKTFAAAVRAKAATYGILLYSKASEPNRTLTLAPFTLIPTPVPVRLLAQAVKISPVFNKLIDGMACALPWLLDALASVELCDEYTARMMAAAREVYITGGSCSDVVGGTQFLPPKNMAESIRLHINRSDYMFERPVGQTKVSVNDFSNLLLKQVELNTVSVSFAGLAQRVQHLHRHYVHQKAAKLALRMGYPSTDECITQAIEAVNPENTALFDIGQTLRSAHEMYCARRAARKDASCNYFRPAVVLFVVFPQERNEFDQRLVELYTSPVECVMLSTTEIGEMFNDGRLAILPEIIRSAGKELSPPEPVSTVHENVGHSAATASTAESSTASSDSKRMSYPLVLREHGIEKEISVVYIRTMYAPHQYAGDRDWRSRIALEFSDAVISPSLPTQLVGAKKIQALWCEPGVLEKFVTPEEATQLRDVFMLQVDCGLLHRDTKTSKVVSMALEAPERFILKPQREGGGNNIYGEDVRRTIEKLKETENYDALHQYILMEKINTPQSPMIVLGDESKGGSDTSVPKSPDVKYILERQGVGELGIYGISLCDGSTLKINRAAGHLLRSKFADSTETGVASGFGFLDSPLLVHEDE